MLNPHSWWWHHHIFIYCWWLLGILPIVWNTDVGFCQYYVYLYRDRFDVNVDIYIYTHTYRDSWDTGRSLGANTGGTARDPGSSLGRRSDCGSIEEKPTGRVLNPNRKSGYIPVNKHGNGRFLSNGGLIRKITDKWSIFPCHVWLPEGRQNGTAGEHCWLSWLMLLSSQGLWWMMIIDCIEFEDKISSLW